MRKIYGIGLAIAVMAMAGCRQTEKEAETADFSESRMLSDGVTLIGDCEPIDNMLLGDSLLWLSGSDESRLLHVYDLSGKPVVAGMAIGHGGDDVLEVSSIRPVNGKIYVYDSRGGIIAEAMQTEGKLHADRIVRELRLYDDAVLLPDSSVLVLPLNSPNAYALLDRQNNLTDSLAYFPPKPTGISDKAHRLACTGMLAYSPADTTFARAVVYDGGIDFFAVRNGRITHTARYANFDMAYTTFRGEGMLPVPSDESRVGYACVYATPARFYASYSEEKSLDNPTALCGEIHVFDHSGKPQYKVMTGSPVQAFAVSDDDSLLYVAEVDAEDNVAVRRYKL